MAMKRSESRRVMSDSLRPPWIIQSMEFSRPEYWRGWPFPSQGIFSTQGSNPHLLRCWCIASRFFTRWITREAQEYWSGLAYPFSSGSYGLRDRTGASCIAGRFFTNWAIREAQISILSYSNVYLRYILMYTKLWSNRNSESKKDTKGIEKNLHVVTGKVRLIMWVKKNKQTKKPNPLGRKYV